MDEALDVIGIDTTPIIVHSDNIKLLIFLKQVFIYSFPYKILFFY